MSESSFHCLILFIWEETALSQIINYNLQQFFFRLLCFTFNVEWFPRLVVPLLSRLQKSIQAFAEALIPKCEALFTSHKLTYEGKKKWNVYVIDFVTIIYCQSFHLHARVCVCVCVWHFTLKSATIFFFLLILRVYVQFETAEIGNGYFHCNQLLVWHG